MRAEQNAERLLTCYSLDSKLCNGAGTAPAFFLETRMNPCCNGFDSQMCPRLCPHIAEDAHEID